MLVTIDARQCGAELHGVGKKSRLMECMVVGQYSVRKGSARAT